MKVLQKVRQKVICWRWQHTAKDKYDESIKFNQLHYLVCPDYNLGPEYLYGGKVSK